MTMEPLQSQNQLLETITSTSEKKYQNSLANHVHDSQQAFGLEKYGITLDQVPDDSYNWQLMALEESVDMNQYQLREIKRLAKEVEYWKGLAMRRTKEMMAHGISD